jgi:hypothetical protein
VSWRARLAREIGGWLLVKLGLLTLLWTFFFSSSHRCIVDGAATANRLALAPTVAQPFRHTLPPGGIRCDRF